MITFQTLPPPLRPKDWPTYMDAYMYCRGLTEVPEEYDYWCGLATIAASLGRRVYVRKGGTKVIPNLYTMLVGPPGCGKNTAIDFAYGLVQSPDLIEEVNPFRGQVTGVTLTNMLGQRVNYKDTGENVPTAKPVFLIMPEVSEALGEIKSARPTVRLLNEWYSAGDAGLIHDAKRSSGHHVVRGACINWLAGSTMPWLKEVVPHSALSGGFTTRLALIIKGYNDRRIPHPWKPDNLDQMCAYLKAWLYCYLSIAGEMTLSPEAQELDIEWYMKREAPDDEDLMGVFKRQHDFVYKIAALLSIGDPLEWHTGPPTVYWWRWRDGFKVWHSLTVKPRHLIEAQRLSQTTMRYAPQLIRDDWHTSRIAMKLRILMKKNRKMTKSQITRMLTNHARVKEINEAINQLETEGIIRRTAKGEGNKKAQVFVWQQTRLSVVGGTDIVLSEDTED